MARRTLNVFGDKSEQSELAQHHAIVERYDSFVLVEATVAEARRLGDEYPVEDISDLYKSLLACMTIDTSRPRSDSR